MEILAEATKLLPETRDRKEVTLRVNPDVARYLKQRDVTVLQEIEEIARRPVLIKSDPMLHAESFDFN
jgi:ribonuclease G